MNGQRLERLLRILLSDARSDVLKEMRVFCKCHIHILISSHFFNGQAAF